MELSMKDMQTRITRRSPRSDRRSLDKLLGALLVAIALASSACAGIVADPADETTVEGTTRFWGYAVLPSQTVNLEALNSSNQWVVVATSTSGTTPTYAGNQSGFYYAIDFNPVTAPTVYRKSAPWTGYARINFRITSPNLGSAETRSHQPTTTPPQGVESNLERGWAIYKGNGVLRIYFHI